MKLPFLGPVVPPHVFSLLPEGSLYVQVRLKPQPGIAQHRLFAYPSGTVVATAAGTPRFTREALSESVEGARRLADGRLSRASVVFPDAWARILPIEFETLPDGAEAIRSMVTWKLKKLLPGVTAELTVVHREMPPTAGGRRLLVAAVPTETLESIEKSFESLGVRVGSLVPESLALFEGLAPRLAARARGDFAFVHRSADALVFAVAAAGRPVLYRHRPTSQGGGDIDQEIRLSLSYYAEKLRGPGLSAVFVHDALPGGELAAAPFPVTPAPLRAQILEADAALDERVAARPELLAAFAAVYGRA